MSEQRQFIEAFLREMGPFASLTEDQRTRVVAAASLVKFPMGETILTRKTLPQSVFVVVEGRARLLAAGSNRNEPQNVDLLERGHAFGWAGVVSGAAREIVTASTDVVCVSISANVFLAELPGLASRPSLIEVFEVLQAEFVRSARLPAQLRKVATETFPAALVTENPATVSQPGVSWFRSADFVPWDGRETGGRFIGIPPGVFGDEVKNVTPAPAKTPKELASAPLSQPDEAFHLIRAEGDLAVALACFEMVCRMFHRPFRKDVLRRVLEHQLAAQKAISLQHCAAAAELVDLNAEFVRLPVESLVELDFPALILWQGKIAVMTQVRHQACTIASPEHGLQTIPLKDLPRDPQGQVALLLLRKGHDVSGEKFGLSWFMPAIKQHKRALIEVLVASLFVQLFTLANPLITQVIIDKVLVQNSVDTLNVLGILLVIVVIFGAVLTSLRTFLFVDTTNRIDLTLGSRIINHLYRLSLRYFQKRPVGEVATRLNELENIRTFLTGTALTLVLDAVFSVLYIVVMLYYNVKLTAVALIAVPLLVGVTLLIAPLIRRQIRKRAEANARTQSYLVETLSGIQTIKAQNLELRSRWGWQERYARYISAGFRSVVTSTSMGAVSTLLSRFSDLGILWYGAHLVIAGELSLGQLIAFRIISGYVTQPLLRLSQSWQNFQEVGLSVERLGDVLDSPQEQSHEQSQNIPMSLINGEVEFDGISFGYEDNGALQLKNVHLSVPCGAFVGVVGESGSGKSTLLKLIPRLYEAKSGRVLVDGFDVSKVELYSLRRQIGTVLQDSLLFEGTVQENIGIAEPDASPEQIIAAARVAVAHDFIMSLPEGYNTKVGEQGRALSGGQRQRIAIARAVLQNPRMVILDEATSALDFPTERQVCSNLASAFKGRTVFFVTHRLHAVRNADIILMMENGTIAESGTHDQLLALRGRYFALLQQQGSQI